MVDIHFYHLARTTLEKALPELLEKTLERKWRAVVMTVSPERVEFFNDYLWAYEATSFLPHGSAQDGRAESQPIWLTHEDERPNDADILFLVDGAKSNLLDRYKRVCIIFDGNNAQAVASARIHYKDLQTAGHTISYWQQGKRGWEKKE